MCIRYLKINKVSLLHFQLLRKLSRKCCLFIGENAKISRIITGSRHFCRIFFSSYLKLFRKMSDILCSWVNHDVQLDVKVKRDTLGNPKICTNHKFLQVKQNFSFSDLRNYLPDWRIFLNVNFI